MYITYCACTKCTFVQASLQRAHDDVEVCLAGARQEISSLKTTISQMVADATTVHCQLEAVKVSVHVHVRVHVTLQGRARQIEALKVII